MAIHELDELAARRSVGFSRADDGEETAVRVEIPSRSGGILFAQCVVTHYGDDVVHVSLPDNIRVLEEAAGLPLHCRAFEGYLETLARLEFARRGGR
jgi:hypothetical protein